MASLRLREGGAIAPSFRWALPRLPKLRIPFATRRVAAHTDDGRSGVLGRHGNGPVGGSRDPLRNGRRGVGNSRSDGVGDGLHRTKIVMAGDTDRSRWGRSTAIHLTRKIT